MNSGPASSDNRQAALQGLAVVGFIALVIAGMWLAVYLARFVPSVTSRVGSAATYLSGIFSSGDGNDGSLAVVPGNSATTTDSGTATTTTSSPTVSAPATSSTGGSTGTHTTIPTQGQESSGTYLLGSGSTTPSYYGQPDLVVSITAVGYMTSSSTDSFIAANTVPNGTRAAVKFTIENKGTNRTGTWRFTANIPTQSNYVFNSPTQQALNPGDRIDFVLGFDQATAGSDRAITITADSDNTNAESNESNNTAKAIVTILGS